MYTLTALAAIASVTGLFACRGAEQEPDGCGTRAADRGMADQLSGNALWHSAAVPGRTCSDPNDRLRSE